MSTIAGHVARAAERVARGRVGHREDEQVGVTGDRVRADGACVRAGLDRGLLGVCGVRGRDGDVMASGCELSGEGTAHVAGADDADLRTSHREAPSEVADARRVMQPVLGLPGVAIPAHRLRVGHTRTSGRWQAAGVIGVTPGCCHKIAAKRRGRDCRRATTLKPDGPLLNPG